MATLTFEALWRDRGVVQGLKTLATQADKTKAGFDKLGGTGMFKRLAASSAQASRAGMSIGTNLQRGIVRPLAGLPGIIGALVGGAVVMGAKRLATEASDMNETVSKTRTIFGTSSKAIESWAKGAARNLGMSRQEALTGASAFGNLFDQLGFGAKQATAMSKGFVQMATDAASFNNANPAEVMEAFQAATRGEYDALQKYIPTASAATIEAEAMRMTHKKSASDLTAADKAAALYQVSVKGLGKAHGDFNRTSGGFANQQRIMAANWADLRVKIGTYFLPMFTKAAKYMNEEGFPALTRIVTVLGTIGGAAGRMGTAVLKVFSTTFATAIDGATTNLSEIADWMETHQETMVRFFIRLGGGAIGFGRTLTALAVSGIRAFGNMAGGLADFIDGAVPGIQGVMEGMASVIQIFDKDAAAAIRDASVKLGEGGRNAAAGLRDTKARAHEAATAVEKRMNPVFDAAESKLKAVGNAEIWKAKQRDAAARASIAIRDIGTKADGSQIKLKTWNERTRLGSVEQARLEGRLRAARTRMLEHREAMIRNNASQGELTKRWNQGKEALYREFRQMDLSKKEARRLAEAYGKVPKKKETKFTTPGLQGARTGVAALDRRINDLNDKTVTARVAFTAGGTRVILKKGTLGGGLLTFATGGYTGNLPPWVPAGEVHGDEHVIKSPSRRKFEAKYPGYLKHINEHGDIPGYRVGGLVQVRGQRHPVPPVGSIVRLIMDRTIGLIRKHAADNLVEPMMAALGSINVNNPRGLTSYRGGRFTNLFAANLRRAEQRSGVTMRVMQGGWRPRTSYSGTSHAGDAVDTQASARLIRSLRAVGIASGDRTGLGNWGSHAHSIPGPRAGRAGGSAIWQWGDYVRRGGARQGLRSPWGLERGGLLTAQVAEKGPERLLSAHDTRSYDRLVSLAGRNGVGGVTYNVTIQAPNYVGSQQDLVNTMVQMAGRGQMNVVLRKAGLPV